MRPRRVAQSELELLTVARALTGGVSPAAVEPLLHAARPVAGSLGPTAMGLLKQTLSRGVVLELGRRGGWRPARHIAGPGLAVGRLWQRHGPPDLHYTPATLELLSWLVRSPLASPARCRPLRHRGSLGLGDELLLYLACDLVSRCPGSGQALARSPLPRGSALCWLGFPDLLGAHHPPKEKEIGAAAWEGLVRRAAVVLEALQQDLARRWVEMERDKRDVTQLELMSGIGESQHRVLTGLAAALDRAGRRDLLGFVMEAGGRLLRHRPDTSQWIGGIARAGALSRRQEAFRAAATLLAELDALHGWVEEARSVRFFDEGYEASQLLLGQWEQVGSEGLAHARQLVSRMGALDAAAGQEQEVQR